MKFDGNITVSGNKNNDSDIFIGNGSSGPKSPVIGSNFQPAEPIVISTKFGDSDIKVDTITLADSVSDKESLWTKVKAGFKADNGQGLYFDETDKKVCLVNHPNHGICGAEECAEGNHPDGHNTAIYDWQEICDEDELQAMANGGGVCIPSGTTFNMYGGTITKNTSQSSGGVYSNGTIKIDGKVTIISNTGKSTLANNVYLMNSAKITIGENFSTESRIDLSVTPPPALILLLLRTVMSATARI